MDVPLTIWLAVLGVIVVMLAIDLFAHRDAHVITAKEAAIWSAVWVAMGIGFGLIIWATAGGEFQSERHRGRRWTGGPGCDVTRWEGPGGGYCDCTCWRRASSPRNRNCYAFGSHTLQAQTRHSFGLHSVKACVPASAPTGRSSFSESNRILHSPPWAFGFARLDGVVRRIRASRLRAADCHASTDRDEDPTEHRSDETCGVWEALGYRPPWQEREDFNGNDANWNRSQSRVGLGIRDAILALHPRNQEWRGR